MLRMSKAGRRMLFGLALVLWPAGSLMTWGQAAEVKLDQIAGISVETLDKMRKTGAAWSSTVDFYTPVQFILDYVSIGDARKITIKAKPRFGNAVVLGTIHQTPQAWYVQMDGRKEKYRPYEAHLGGPVIYSILSLSELRMYYPEMNLAIPRATPNGRVAFRSQLPVESMSALQEMILQAKKIIEANPRKDNAELSRKMSMMQDMIDHGTLVELDPANGVVTRQLNPKMELLCESFRFLGPEEAGLVSINPAGFADKTGRIAESMENVAMMGYLPGWKVGDQSGDAETVFLDLLTGQFRRVPSQSFDTGPGCFSKDRKIAWVTTLEMGNLGMSITEIDLKTGANQPLGTKLSGTGLNVFPAISSDGSRLAFLHKEIGQNVLDSGVVVVDLNTREEKLIGGQADRGPVHWAQKDQLVFELRDPVDLTKPGEGGKILARRIAVMDLSGQTRVLIVGSSPVVVGGGDVILFEDVDDKWKTCDLEGNKIKHVGDGLTGFYFPSASPDGKRVLFMRLDKQKGPQPWVVELESGKATPVKVAPGLWMMPSWR